MLYILTFSSYLMSFIIVPYETRILGVEFFGVIGVSTAIMAYFQLFIDFGFLLSATEEVSANREDKNLLSKIFTSVTINKIFLATLSAIVLFVLCLCIGQWKKHMLFFMLSLLATIINSLMPDYLYRGIEDMRAITIRTVLLKFAFTMMVFIFVKDSSGYILIPILQLTGNFIALLSVYVHLYLKVKVKFIKCKFVDLLKRFKKSAMFFLSRIATTIYTATNTIILDFMSNGGMTAFYTSADKLVVTAKNGLSPISDSLYPYMVKNRDFKVVKFVLLLLEPFIILASIILFVWAEPLCLWFFGEEYGMTAPILRAMLPVVIVTLPSYIFGFPVLGAMGLNKHANYSTIIGSVLHVIVLIALLAIGKLNMVSLGLATSLTETVILVYRLIIVIKNRNIFVKKDEPCGE